MKIVKLLLWGIALIFLFPALTHLGYWVIQDQPRSWRSASWASAGILPSRPTTNDARIYLMSARTGGLKGAFSDHSWLVIKKPGSNKYDRYDVVGWGYPVRKNAFDPDGRWYSNLPIIHHVVEGEAAIRAIPLLEKAIANYRWQNPGDYVVWPGPNSNSFISTIINATPMINWQLPATAVGRDYPANGSWLNWDDKGLRATLAGYAGLFIAPGLRLELNFLGLVAGFDLSKRTLFIPAWGEFRFAQPASRSITSVRS